MNVLGRVAALLSLTMLLSCGEGSRQNGLNGIGEVDSVVRVVRGTLINHHTARQLAVEDAVYWQELIETEEDSATQLEFGDGTKLSVGPDARVLLDEFVYGGPPGTDRMVLTVTKGISRFITGNMNKAAYEIRAPGAIIGVRGTDFTIVVDDQSGTTICLVHHGEVALKRSDGGAEVILHPGQASKVIATQPEVITRPALPSPDITRKVDRMQGLIREARLTRDADQTAREATVRPAEQTDSRMAAFRPPDMEHGSLADFANELRSVGGRASASPAPAAAAAPVTTAPVAVPTPTISPRATSAPATSAPASTTTHAASAPTSSAATSASGGATAGTSTSATEPVPLLPEQPGRQPCSGASCLSQPPENRVTSPTHL